MMDKLENLDKRVDERNGRWHGAHVPQREKASIYPFAATDCR
ncbi:MAG TPA: hypothetical protein PKA30_10405 [Accumulibacter sp.]|nr:hypothetical protein [Accumulibacter sp.]HMV05946.1 hypothetical protein [Accumulibacter sp.]HMW63446.1 hypothetical protein [Accumulibacter sp.]HMX69869.1 hypothetical protein [Accumulibacter sp.]HNB66895.1 hypothetical protein [Accumulibacter sp.]HND39214.1 hypothetical protein [Accumulibacter sp.]